MDCLFKCLYILQNEWIVSCPNALKRRTLGAETCLLTSEQTDSHIVYCFAGGVSTELSEVEQLCIMATLATQLHDDTRMRKQGAVE